MPRILLAWIGMADLDGPKADPLKGVGPIAQALRDREFERAVLLTDHSPDVDGPFLAWLAGQTQTTFEPYRCRLTSPTHFGDIYEAARDAIVHATGDHSPPPALTFHLSPGTPAMAAVWIILGKTRFARAELIESSRQHGVKTALVPFDLWADFIPDLLHERDEALKQGSAGQTAAAPAFDDIVHYSRAMARVIQRAKKVAYRNVPVLIEGESGSGKEMLARAIHRASPRAKKPFVAINCGAIPETLVESELFGHEKDAFTGATKARAGHFEAANGGTLFLDELGELPLAAQVKLLRVLQEGEVMPVGGSKPKPISVRVIAATHRNLIADVGTGRFREDLFFRLAVAVLRIPPLREREEDLSVLIEHLLEKINEDAASEPGYQEKRLSAAGRNLLRQHTWPGNVRELQNTLQRAAIWSDGAMIGVDDVREALLPMAAKQDDLLSLPFTDGFDIRKVTARVTTHFIDRALTEAGGSKTKAAALLGLKSYQNLNQWLVKLKQDM